MIRGDSVQHTIISTRICNVNFCGETAAAAAVSTQVVRKELEKKNIVKKMDFVFKNSTLSSSNVN